VPDIKVYYNNDGYGYEYTIIGSDHKKRHVKKSGFKTLKEAQEAAEKSYKIRKKQFHAVDTIPSVIPRIKKFDCTNKLWDILTAVTIGGVGFVCVLGTAKLVKEFKDKVREANTYVSASADEIPTVINPLECDFSNLHVIIRSAKKETYATCNVISDQLNTFGLSNEVISKDSDYIDRINNALENYSDSNIILINVEMGVESEEHVSILNDTSNKNKYPSDVLASCINTSCNEYNLNPRMLSGVATGHGWRLETSIEKKLISNGLNDKISQLTIDLPENIGNETMRNTAATSIVNGLIRYCYLPKEERFEDIYYCARYGDTINNVADSYHISGDFVYQNSELNPYRLLTVGDTLVIGNIPKSADYHYVVNNPLVTDDISNIESTYIPYVVQEGDTLTKIANMYGVRIDDIRINSSNPNNIRLGETIFIPRFNYYLTTPKEDLLNRDKSTKNK